MAFNNFKDFLRARREAKRFKSLTQDQRKIVFYSEDKHSMIHFSALIDKLATEYGEQLCYLTSAPDDPILENHHSSVLPFYIGEGTVRTMLFSQMEVDLLIMTMPDLENYYLKRSKAYPVHYLYLFHAMVSTHSNYRKAAFDHYDTIFCTGSFQIDEIRATESTYNLKPKNIFKDGYRRLEVLMDDVKQYRDAQGGPSADGAKTIIVAPTWGKNAILETCGTQLVQHLLDAGYSTIVRPHPMTSKHSPELIESISNKFQQHARFKLETDVRDKSTLYESHLMISDWSGVAIEYAFSCERPVVYIDVPKKCNNPEAEKIPQIPIEVSIREKIGCVVAPDEIASIAQTIEQLYEDTEAFVDQIRLAREESVFNLGNSLDGAVKEIVDIAQKCRTENRT
jgi:hypothetical protein